MTNSDSLETQPRKRKWLRRAGVVLLVAIVAFFPLPVRDEDYAAIVVRDVLRYRDGQPLLYKHRNRAGYEYGAAYTDPDWKWHFYSDTSLDLSALTDAGLNRMTKTELDQLNWDEWYDAGNFLFEIRDVNVWRRDSDRCPRMNTHWGHNGSGFRICAYRCLLGRYALYWPEWIT